MYVSQNIESLRKQIDQWRSEKMRIGFVPTMGHLHAGHLSLVEEAKSICDKVVVSIYVNPLQFNEASDFQSYPQTIEDDKSKLESASTDLLFLPDTSLMYPNGQNAITKVCVPDITEVLEGECRPGHFDGVSTVVLKLFNMVQADCAFFGEKDYQQLLLIQKMVADLNLSIDIVPVATCREGDDLAMSSRNARLDVDQRRQAPALYQALEAVRQALRAGSNDYAALEGKAMKALQAAGLVPEYVSIRRRQDLQPASQPQEKLIVLAAARLGDVRLIDNLLVD